MSQKDYVLNYLKTHKTISQKEAGDKLGIMDLAGVMRDLRDAGYETGDVWYEGFNRFGDKTRFKKYFIVKGKKNDTNSKSKR